MKMLRLIRLFFRPAGLDFADAGGGIASGYEGFAGANRMPSYRGFVPGNAVGNDVKWNQAMQMIQAATDRNTGMVDPVLLDSYSNMLGIDLSGLITSGDIQGGQYADLARMAGSTGNVMADQAMRTMAAGRDTYDLARDPNNSLHDYLKHVTTENARNADSTRGIAMGDVSSGNENDALRKFEMDWQNNLLGRALQGDSALTASGYYGDMGLNNAMTMAGMTPTYTGMSYQAPIAGRTSAYSMPMDWASAFTGAENYNMIGPYAQMQSNINPYLGLSASSGANQSYYGLDSNIARTNMMTNAAGSFNTGYRGESGMGKPENWVGMGGGGGGGMGSIGSGYS